MADESAPALLTIQETCDQLRVSRTTLHGLISSGELPSIVIGRARRVPRHELDRFINDRLMAR